MSLPPPRMMGLTDVPSFRPAWLLGGLVCVGIGFGFVEAAVVADLRAILSPIGRQDGATSADNVFPIYTLEKLDRANPVAARLMRVEVLREAATLILLAGAGLAAGRTFLQRFSAFLVAFGIWDLCYYLFLKVLLGWPASMWTWDILFLIPVPWAAPVVAPAVVAASMVVAGSVVLSWESTGRRFRVARWEWASVCAGGTCLIAAFCWDAQHIAAGGMPSPFPWPIFLAGETIALGGFLHASWATVRTRDPLSRASTAPSLAASVLARGTRSNALRLAPPHDQPRAG
jgi:hypothetical protein